MKHEVKPWGVEVVWANTQHYSGRILVIKEGEKTPFGYYKNRDVTILVLQGVVNLVLEARTKMLMEQEVYHIDPRVMHQIVTIKGDATILEAGTQITGDFVEVQK